MSAAISCDFAELQKVLNGEKDAVEGDVFIIPNGLYKISDGDCDDLRKCFDCKPWHMAVEVWMTNDDCENWSCHGYPINLRELPTSVLLGKSDGDVVEFFYELGKEYNNRVVKVRLRLNQADYRYGRFGSFAGVLSNLVSRYHDSIDRAISGK